MALIEIHEETASELKLLCSIDLADGDVTPGFVVPRVGEEVCLSGEKVWRRVVRVRYLLATAGRGQLVAIFVAPV